MVMDIRNVPVVLATGVEEDWDWRDLGTPNRFVSEHLLRIATLSTAAGAPIRRPLSLAKPAIQLL
jgi:hypothetical protein